MKTALVAILTVAASFAFAETYKIDTTASKVMWKAGKKVGSFHNGDIKVKSGTVDTDAKGEVTGANVVVDMKTIGNEDLKDNKEYQGKLVGHLASDDFFKVDKFPESTFKLTKVTPVKGKKGEYKVAGDLTMIGKTEKVEFPAKITTDAKSIKGTGTIKVERLKWGLQYGSGSIFKTLTADKIINDSFDITLDITATK